MTFLFLFLFIYHPIIKLTFIKKKYYLICGLLPESMTIIQYYFGSSVKLRGDRGTDRPWGLVLGSGPPGPTEIWIFFEIDA